MLTDSLTYLEADFFPENPSRGLTFYLSVQIGDFEPGLYTYSGTEWVSGNTVSGAALINVRCTTTEPVIRSGLQIVEGVALVAGDDILLKNQDDPSENGVYRVNSGAWQRSPIANTNAKVKPGMMVFIVAGENFANTIWYLVSTGLPIDLDTSPLNFAVFSGNGQIQIGAGLTRVGDSIALDNSGIQPGTYRVVTFDRHGRATAGSNPTTLEGFGINDGQKLITGGASSITENNLLASRVLISNAQGKVAASDMSLADLENLIDLNDNFATEMAKKQDKVNGAASTIVGTNVEANRALISNAQGKVAVSDVTAAEMGRLSGVTSPVQAQLDARLSKTGGDLTGPLGLAAAPTLPNQAANKTYVDQQVSSVAPMPRSIYASIPGDVVQFTTGVRWYPPFKCKIQGVRAFIDVAPNMTAVQVDVKKNGATMFPTDKPTIAIGAHESGQAALDVGLLTTDYITLAVLAGDGKDLSVRIDYIADVG